MNLKSLLLSSAAALIATTGAKAADAIIIAEPEPVEYVRVCDAYGVGFFYIPGTETCLRIGGELRFQLGATNDEGLETDGFELGEYDDVDELLDDYVTQVASGHTPNFHGYEHGAFNTLTRARVFFDARSETELGTLRGYVRMQFDRTSGAAGSSYDALANHAWLSLGGLRMGWSDSAFDDTPTSGAAAYGTHSDSGLRYSAGMRNFIQYNFSGGNGMFATVSLEDHDTGYWESASGPATWSHTEQDYIPDVVVRAGVNQGWGALWAALGWDEDRTADYSALVDDALGAPPLTQVGKSGFGLVAGTQINVPNAPGSSLRVLGFYADSDNAYNPHGGQWSVLGSYGHQINSQLFASIGGQYTDNLYLTGTDIGSGFNRWDVEVFATWKPVENFQVMGEVVYTDVNVPDVTGSWSGFLRFSRFF